MFELFSFVWFVFKKEPANWVMAVLLLISIVMQMRYQSKKIRITPQWSKNMPDRFELLVSNTGSAPVGIKSYGFKKWNGDVYEDRHKNTVYYHRMEPEHPEEELIFYDRKEEKSMSIEVSEIYYFFVKTSGGNTFKKYTKNPLLSWIIRFIHTFRS